MANWGNTVLGVLRKFVGLMIFLWLLPLCGSDELCGEIPLLSRIDIRLEHSVPIGGVRLIRWPSHVACPMIDPTSDDSPDYFDYEEAGSAFVMHDQTVKCWEAILPFCNRFLNAENVKAIFVIPRGGILFYWVFLTDTGACFLFSLVNYAGRRTYQQQIIRSWKSLGVADVFLCELFYRSREKLDRILTPWRGLRLAWIKACLAVDA